MKKTAGVNGFGRFGLHLIKYWLDRNFEANFECNFEGNPSGVYLWKLNVCDFTQTKKLMLVK